jgi:protein kinase A
MKKISSLLGGKKKTKESSSDSPTSPTSAKSPLSPTQNSFAAAAFPSDARNTLSAAAAAPNAPLAATAAASSDGQPAAPAPPPSASNPNSSASAGPGPSIQSLLNSSAADPSPNASMQNVSGQQLVPGAANLPRETKGKYALADFNIQRTLGTGSFGRVHLVQSKHNERFYAIKVLKKAQIVKMKQVEHTNDERRMLQRVKHPFLITLWGTFQDCKNLYMVMDFVEGGELFSLLRRSQVWRHVCFN